MQITQPTPDVSARYGEIDVEQHRQALTAILQAVAAAPSFDERVLRRILRRHPRNGAGFFSKSQLVDAYRQLCATGDLAFEPKTLNRLQMKPIRTQSGVAPVAVLTKPAGCPGRCIFCPNDPDMPKSYLSREPGAQRALRHHFDPFEQARSRLTALSNVGHPIQKAELIILGGTWSAYAPGYQAWFIRRCLDALNGAESTTLAEAQARNEQAPSRCVGLTVETRPDWVTPEEVVRLRRLGVTRVQIGIQSLDDRILALNERGHTMEAARRACRLLRAAGFKLLLHWMPNLYGATPASDRADFARLWSDPDMQPDELKIYPCALVEGTRLYELWQQRQYTPYDEHVLVDLLADCKAQVPETCRLSRVVRDIPSDYVVEGNRLSNLREEVQAKLAGTGRECRCIRCREVGDQSVDIAALQLRVTLIHTGAGLEHFIAAETPAGRLAGFLRLLVPNGEGERPFELEGCAVIREVHVYGPALGIGATSMGEVQHSGLGSRLLTAAEEITRGHGIDRLAVIAALGTRDYYRRRGFELEKLYMHKRLTTPAYGI
jgi:elongator complex protein 3